jgi:hypothetical protein
MHSAAARDWLSREATANETWSLQLESYRDANRTYEDRSADANAKYDQFIDAMRRDFGNRQ